MSIPCGLCVDLASSMNIQYYFLDSVLVSHVNELTKRFTRAAKIDPILS